MDIFEGPNYPQNCAQNTSFCIQLKHTSAFGADIGTEGKRGSACPKPSLPIFALTSIGEYIDLCIEEPGADRGDLRLAQASLSAYAGRLGTPLGGVPLLDLALPGWLGGYFEYVASEYESNKSRGQERKPGAERAKWAKRYLKCARKLVNRAIRGGLLPNVDFFGSIPGAPEFARRQGVEEKAKASSELLKLSRTKPTYRASEQRPSSLPTATASTEAAGGTAATSTTSASAEATVRPASAAAPSDAEAGEEQTFGALDLYMLCMHCCGLELDELYSLADTDIDASASTVRIPWAGAEITLSQTVVAALQACRAMPQFGSRGPEVVARALSAAGVSLFQARSVFADWLRFAKDQGASDATVMRLIEARRKGGEVPEDLAQAIQSVAARMGAGWNKYKRQWYCVYAHRSTGEDKRREMLASDSPIVRGMAGREADTYCPDTSEISAPRVKGRRITDPRAVLRRYLFVCCSPYEIGKIGQAVPGISVMGRRRNGVKEYAVVPAAEIYTLRLMLESIRGTEAELMLEDEDVRAAIDTTPLRERERVRIMTPAYQEYDAEVVKVRQNSYYTVRLAAIGKTFVLKDVPRALIRRIA